MQIHKRLSVLLIALIVLVSVVNARTYITVARASVATDGIQGDGPSRRGDTSTDGRFVSFESEATTLVTGDTNVAFDIFVHDRESATTVIVSVASDGTKGNMESRNANMSPNGRFVVFASSADNLVAGDTNASQDVFLHDRDADNDGIFDEPGAILTIRVSVSSAGAESDGSSGNPYVSADGRYVAFQSGATNLVAGDTNASTDIFVHDRDADSDGIFDESGSIDTSRVSLTDSDTEADDASTEPVMSADGRYVAFSSEATNLVTGDANSSSDIFVRDRQTNATIRVSVTDADGETNGDSITPAISADGRFVVYETVASNVIADDNNGFSDIFLYDRDEDGDGIFDEVGETEVDHISRATGTVFSDNNAVSATISDDGAYVAFASAATNIISGDTNGSSDIFVRDRTEAKTRRASIGSNDNQSNGNSNLPFISGDGRVVVYQSGATNLVNGDTNGVQDVFVSNAQPRSPQDLAGFAISGSQVVITWEGDAESDSFILEHSADAGATWIPRGSTTANYFVDTGLTCVTTYSFRVIAVNEDGNSNPSDSIDITTGGCPIELLVNTGFETDTDGDKLPDNWAGSNLTGDKQKCNKDKDGDGVPDKIFAHSGDCAFAFKASVGENSVIEQVVADVSAVTVADSFQISMWVTGKNADKGAVYKLKFNYANGSKDSLKLSSAVGTFDYTNYTSGILQLPDAVTSASATIKFKGTAGKITVDDVSLSLTELGLPVPGWVWDLATQGNVFAPLPSQNGGLIPLPPAQ